MPSIRRREADLFFAELMGETDAEVHSRDGWAEAIAGRGHEVFDDALAFGEHTQAEDHGSALRAITPLRATSTRPTVANARQLMKAICLYHGIPWRLGFVVMEHEGGARLFRHRDGVMQTIAVARRHVVPRIPRPLKLTLLGLPMNNTLTAAQLNRRIHRAFRRHLAVQIAAGVQELAYNLDAFSGYVALALIGYNAGPGWAYHIVNRGRSRRRPRGVTAQRWEELCRMGASLLHRHVGTGSNSVRVLNGRYKCDSNIPSWFAQYSVRDRGTNLSLPAYQYLRRIRARIRQHAPTAPCNAASHGHRSPGTGNTAIRLTRWGALDKLYDPTRLRGSYQGIGPSAFRAIRDDRWPLRVHDARLFKAPLLSVTGSIAPHMVDADPLATAIVRNELYSTHVGWGTQQNAIERLLGFTNMSPTPRAFAAAVTTWQRRAGLPATGDIDGRTWQRMRRQLRRTIPGTGLPIP